MRPGESWQWSPLPPLSLEGAGTPGAEALDSYVVRLAATQGLTPVAFLDALDKCCGNPPLRNNRPRSAVLGPGSRFMDRLGALERLTGGQLLRGGTFYALSDVLRRQHYGLSPSRRWCPLCLAEMESTGVGARLAWALSDLSSCYIHGVMIVDACPTCGVSQPYSLALANRQSCVHCECSLITTPTYAEGLSKDRQWIDQCIYELIGHLSKPCPMIIPGGYERYLVRLCNEGDLFGTDHGLPSGPPSIRSLLRLSAIMGVSMLDVLIRDDELPSKRLELSGDITHLLPTPNESRLHLTLRLELIVEEALRHEISPLPPMKTLLDRQGLSKAPIYLIENASYQRYLRKYKVQGVHGNSRERKALFQAAFVFLERDDRPSIPAIVKNLSATHRVSPQVVRRYVKSALCLIAIECSASSKYLA